jgi:nitroreductase
MRTQDLPRDLLSAPLRPEATLPDILRWAVAHGCAAPSELNSQPWRFGVVLSEAGDEATIELLLDRSRRLEVIDPDGREATLACGAALLNLRLALRGAELGTRVLVCPDPSRADLLARLSVSGKTTEPARDRLLRLAIPQRSTHRGAFRPGAVPAEVVDRLIAEAGYEGAVVAVVTPDERPMVDALTEEAERQHWVEPGYRREVAAWSRPNTSGHHDGVPGYAHELVGWRSWLQPSLIRAGLTERPRPGEANEEPLLLVLGSASDNPAALVRAGAGMQRLLLAARTLGLAASYLNATLHVPLLRRELGRAVGLDHPQVVLRVGYADPDQATPRRRESAVLDLRTPGPTAH